MIGVLSDAHGNDPAFQHALGHLTRLGAELFVFLGDAVGYIPSTAVVTSLRELGGRVTCIPGNHEEILLGSGIPPHLELVYQLSQTRKRPAESDIHFLSSWPRLLM